MNRKKILGAVLALFILTAPAPALLKIANDPLRISVGARVLGMGKAFSGIADDLNAIFINPAGISDLPGWQITSMSGRFVKEIDYLQFAAAYPTAFGAFGIGYGGSGLSFIGPAVTFESVDGVRYVESSTEGVSYNYSNTAWMLSYAADLHRLIPLDFIKGLSLGTNLKQYVQQMTGPGITSGSALGYNMDVGLRYRYSPWLSLAYGRQNFLQNKLRWDNGTEENLPATAKLGIGLEVFGPQGLFQPGKQSLNFALDVDTNQTSPEEPPLYHIGMEWRPLPNFALRFGNDQDVVGRGSNVYQAVSNTTFGVGINIDRFRFDYAYHTYLDVPDNDTHYFSLSYGLWEKARPAAFVEVIDPEDKSISYKKEITLLGAVLEGNVKRVVVNGKRAEISQDGFFSLRLPLEIGKNTISIAGYDRKGKLLQKKLRRVLRLVTYPDLAPDYFAKLAVEYLATLGIITGYPDGTFRPAGRVGRAEMAALLMKARGTRGEGRYSNMARTAKEGIVKGYTDGTFKPTAYINRAEGTVILVRFDKRAKPRLIEVPFQDIPARHWAISEITAAKEAGMLDYLAGGPFEPDRELSRGELAEMLSRTKYVGNKIKGLLDFESGYGVE